MTRIETTKRGPQRRSTVNREKIYLAAVRLFEANGFEETTVQDIADEAGCARASVFNHFPEKAALLGEFFARFNADVIAAARRAEGQGYNAQLQAMFAAIGRIANKNKGNLANFSALSAQRGPLADVEKEADDDMTDFLAELVDTGQQSGELAADIDPQFTAQLLLGVMTACAHDWVSAGQVTSLQGLLRKRFDLVCRGIGKK